MADFFTNTQIHEHSIAIRVGMNFIQSLNKAKYMLNPLTAVSPIDGRYHQKLQDLSEYFSEFALIKYRVKVEVEYFIALVESNVPELSNFDQSKLADLRNIYKNMTPEMAMEVKETEKITNHDVKSVEYYIKAQFEKLGLEPYLEFIHFGLTSQDINNTANPMMLKDFIHQSYMPEILGILGSMHTMANDWKAVSMLAKTHGQPASPTRLGKEIKVFAERIENQLALLEQIPFSGKFGGATGGFNAHYAAYPSNDWGAFGNNFLTKYLKISRQQTTTQIEHYDNMGALFDTLKRINTICIDFARDMWQYISMEYFKQKINKNEVGSSAMPHKVNPIDFENAEGNFGLANAIFEHLSAKLPISRLQRDLTDSTVSRNIGVPCAHTILAFQSLAKGMSKLLLNEQAIAKDLDNNWAVLAEAIQTVLRKEGYPKPYEALKGLTRNNETVTESTIHQFVDTLEINDDLKAHLKSFTPFNYVGKV